jgi:hypothetical protein
MTVTHTLDFTGNDALWEGFVDVYGDETKTTYDPRWKFDSVRQTATYVW